MRRATRVRPRALLAVVAPTPASLTLHAPGAGGALGCGVCVAAVSAARAGLFRGCLFRPRMSIPTHVPEEAAQAKAMNDWLLEFGRATGRSASRR